MRHLLPSQYTRVSITAEDLLDLVEKEREGKPLGPGGFRHSRHLDLGWNFGAEDNQTRHFRAPVSRRAPSPPKNSIRKAPAVQLGQR